MNTKTFGKLWRTAKNEVKEAKGFIFTICVLFLLSAVFGFVFSDKLGFLDKILRDVLSQVKNLEGTRLAAYILINNVRSALFSMILGIVFGFVPVFNALFNGVIVGYVLARVAYLDGFQQLWKIIPHGVFELPAIFIALGIGLRLGVSVFSSSGRNKLSSRLYNAILVFVFIVLPLLIIAAIIESLLISFY